MSGMHTEQPYQAMGDRQPMTWYIAVIIVVLLATVAGFFAGTQFGKTQVNQMTGTTGVDDVDRTITNGASV